jgi:tellurite resistance protein
MADTGPPWESEALMDKTDLQETRQNLEDLFFHKENQKLLEKHRALQQMKETEASLAKATGIRNPAILKKLVELNVRPETLVSLALVPLVEIAWADGRVDDKEKQAILQAVKQTQPQLGGMNAELLDQWLQQRPAPQLLEAWLHYTRGLCEQLQPEGTAALKAEFIKQAQAIANASGGFLRLGGKISKAEAELLKKLEGAFEAGKT